MVWAGINIDGRTDLGILWRCNSKDQRYTNEILRPHIVPYAAAIGNSFLLTWGNTKNHTARLVEIFLKLKQYSVWRG
ncbi:hypothetical protein TNCV_1877161 [Trichonephila clavipes]|nr:hypothetical protein TNCV_1877161 [Trichonephila clavipes]